MVKLHRLNDVRKDLIQRSLEGSIPVLYFKKIINVGDLVSVYLIERISRRPVHAVSTVFLPHLTAVGSTIGSSSKQSYIWGSGSIDGKVPLRGVDPAKIFALRGKRTQALLEQITGQRITVPLGDPAVLMPNFYDRAVPITHEIGLIPHFDEIDSLFGLFRQSFEGVKLIDPRMVPEAFVDEMRSCKTVMSSSLHGLILANAYDIPTVWFSASDKLLGKTWKFLDYYSATDATLQTPVKIRSREDLLEAFTTARTSATCHKMRTPNDVLQTCFPDRFVR